METKLISKVKDQITEHELSVRLLYECSKVKQRTRTMKLKLRVMGGEKGGENLPKSKHISIWKENKDIKRRIFGEITLNKSSQLMNVNSFTL